jgi:hypothetical protein
MEEENNNAITIPQPKLSLTTLTYLNLSKAIMIEVFNTPSQMATLSVTKAGNIFPP